MALHRAHIICRLQCNHCKHAWAHGTTVASAGRPVVFMDSSLSYRWRAHAWAALPDAAATHEVTAREHTHGRCPPCLAWPSYLLPRHACPAVHGAKDSIVTGICTCRAACAAGSLKDRLLCACDRNARRLCALAQGVVHPGCDLAAGL